MIWLRRGTLSVRDGTLVFASGPEGEPGDGIFDIPFQALTAILLQPGCAVTHDAMRICARHGVGLLSVGEDGVRMYASMPFGPDDSRIARAQVRLWADLESRRHVARRLYAYKLGEVLPNAQIEVLRGIEGARAKEAYRLFADRFGVPWTGRVYDRQNPQLTDPLNLAINHASSAALAAAHLAVAAVGCIPKLGFIHEDSGLSLCLDIADTYRDDVVLTAAFMGYQRNQRDGVGIEAAVRKAAGRILREKQIIPGMIDRLKLLFDG